MARTRAQLATQNGRTSLAPKDQGKRPQGIQKHRSTRRTTRLQQRLAPQPTECDQPHPSLTKESLFTQGSATTGKRDTKRPVDALDQGPDSPQKGPRRSPRLSLMENTSASAVVAVSRRLPRNRYFPFAIVQTSCCLLAERTCTKSASSL